MAEKEGEPATEPEKQEPTVEELLNELPLKDEHKALLVKLVGGVGATLNQISTRLDNLEKQPAPENPDIYEGLSADQRFQVMMAKASAPAAAAQQALMQNLFSRAVGGGGGGGGGGGEIAQLLGNADKIKAFRDIFSPEPTPVQVAMEKAQVASVLAQTRLMNKVAGKATSDYLDKIEKDITTEPGGEEA